MDFTIQYECGERIVVSEGAAGSQRDCGCGRIVAVPSLTGLRLQAGLTPQAPNPTVAIPYMIADGELPTAKACVCCKSATPDAMTVTAECRIVAAGEDSSGLGFVALFLVFGFWAFLFRYLRRTSTEHGGDSVIVHCPIRVCRGCRPKFVDSTVYWIWGSIAQVVASLMILAWSGWGAILLGTAAATIIVALILRNRLQSSLRRMLCLEPIYEQLLDEFLNARLIPYVD